METKIETTLLTEERPVSSDLLRHLSSSVWARESCCSRPR